MTTLTRRRSWDAQAAAGPSRARPAPQGDPLAWWTDKLVEVTLPDGHRCRGWVREAVRGHDDTPLGASSIYHVLGWLTVTLLHEPPTQPRPAGHPAEITIPIGHAGPHGQPRNVQLLTPDQQWWATLHPPASPPTQTPQNRDSNRCAHHAAV